MYHDPVVRGRAMAVFMTITTFGPLLGPVVSGFISVVSWRWTYWLGLIIAGVTWVPLLLMPETYPPVILKRRARRLRKMLHDPSFVAPIELENRGPRYIVTVVLTRPIRMILFEPLVLFSCVYLSFVYTVFYIFFQAYPIMYRGEAHANSRPMQMQRLTHEQKPTASAPAKKASRSCPSASAP